MAQMVGNGRLADLSHIGQIANIHLTLRQGGNNPNPAGVTQSAEQFGHLGSSNFV
jgi:hypothetical protein